MKRIIAIVFVCMMFVACGPSTGAPVDVKSAGAVDYEVKFLFEKDGVAVFRFVDDGRYRYFTIGNGSFQPQVQTKTVHTGKTQHTESWNDGANTQGE